MPRVPFLHQVNLVVRDMGATLSFYRRLGWSIATPTAEHAAAELPNGIRVEFDSIDFVRVWDSGYGGATGGSTVVGLSTETRDQVDELYTDLIAHGGRARQPPYDAFWGSRYAIVDDPDGNPLGLMSPSDDAKRIWPPREPPAVDSEPTTGEGAIPAPLIEFPADDADRARRFWRAVLDIDLTPRVGDAGSGWETDTHGLRLGIHERGPGPGDTASLPYFTVTDLAATLERVREHGGAVIHPGERWAICRDSEGSPFALAATPGPAR
jgi:predicted enzyme related to lactoylglutathione lyase